METLEGREERALFLLGSLGSGGSFKDTMVLSLDVSMFNCGRHSLYVAYLFVFISRHAKKTVYIVGLTNPTIVRQFKMFVF